jgi:hypothetical protein
MSLDQPVLRSKALFKKKNKNKLLHKMFLVSLPMHSLLHKDLCKMYAPYLTITPGRNSLCRMSPAVLSTHGF